MPPNHPTSRRSQTASLGTGSCSDRWDGTPRRISLRHLAIFATLLLINTSLANDCCGQWFRGFAKQPDPIPVAFASPPSKEQFFQWHQQHVQNIRQLDASVRVAMTGTPKLKGTLQIETPRRLRLKAGVLGVNEMGVDVGSNDDRFWIWTRVPLPGQPPTMMFASHEGFRQSSGEIRKSVPLEPEWVIEALGLIDFRGWKSHSAPERQSDNRMKMTSVRMTGNGKQYRVTLFDAARGIIEQQSLYNAQGSLLAWTNASEFRYYPQHRVSLPHKVEMHLLQNGQSNKLTVTTDTYNINSLFGDPARMWGMPQPSNVQVIDLTEGFAGSSNGGTAQPSRQQPMAAQPSIRSPQWQPTRPAGYSLQPAKSPGWQSLK